MPLFIASRICICTKAFLRVSPPEHELKDVFWRVNAEKARVCVQAGVALGRKGLSAADLGGRSHSRPAEFLTISHSTLSRRL